ncbi:Fur family transcriptional regulator [Aeromicrobium sp. CTD01-1L150]|uniref:Fur family transcriptional regulator n=1 Tax=Aeromicrobium sp. CTD01-1L150 TaxID=3341830 RepID=UPI0035C1A83E
MSAESIATVFKKDGQRTTKQRRAVAEIVESLEVFASAQSIHEVLRSRGNPVGLSTVYRNLQALADVGAIDSLRDQSGEVLYRKCGDQQHHHHLVCESCGTTVEIAASAVEKWTSRVAEDNGFVNVSHSIEIFGTCPSCAA